MSSKLVKLGPQGIVDPNDKEVLTLVVMQSGKINLQAPTLHPRDTSKILVNLGIDVIYSRIDILQESITKPELPELVEKPDINQAR